MIIDLTATTSSEIAAALLKARRNAGSPAMGMVGTIVVVADESTHHDALKAANEAGREHPSRVLIVIQRTGRGTGSLDAEVRIGEGLPGEAVLLRLHGELARHPASVVLPLLLPDSPVVVWWPVGGPTMPADDQIGALGRRRVTDAAASRRSGATFRDRAQGYAPGDTDFAWTRLTPWRALLAAALDQYPTEVTGARITSARANASADLLAAWLQSRLRVPVELTTSRGPGITAVRLLTPSGEIALTRPDGKLATFTIPGQPDRPVALHRRSTSELLSEELRRLDPDDVYSDVLRWLVDHDRESSVAKPTRAAAPATGTPKRCSAPTSGTNAKTTKAVPTKGTAKGATAKGSGQAPARP